MLGKTKIIKQTDARKIITGLKKIGKQISAGTFKFDPKAEDVHTNIQQALKKIAGTAADKLHTARSRNDLIATDMKMYCMDAVHVIVDALTEMQKSILKFGRKYPDVLIPAYTHLQAAQVVLLPHYMLAYVEMLERDKLRLEDAFMRMDASPLGSCALSGSSLPINREMTAKELGFVSLTRNSIDAVSDRDFILELLSGLAILGTHCSRMAEDLIIWVTDEFDRVTLDDAFCTGSSIMPHKRNPDMLELIRGEAAKLISNLNELLILVKGLPLTYNRDLQLDKPPLFESVEKSLVILELLSKIFASMSVSEEQQAMLEFDTASNECLYSVDLVDYLILKGASYREAHDAIGALCADVAEKNISIHELKEKDLKKYSKWLGEDIKKLLNPQHSVKAKKSFGSTSPVSVKRQLAFWKKKLK